MSDHLVLVSIPFIVTSVMASFFIPGSSYVSWKTGLCLLSALIGIGASVFRRHIKDTVRVCIYGGALLLAAIGNLLADGLWGQGLLLLVAALMLASAAKPSFRKVTAFLVLVILMTAAALHLSGSLHLGLSSDEYSHSWAVWISALSLFCIIGIWTVGWGQMGEKLDAREREMKAARRRFGSLFRVSGTPMLLLQRGCILSANSGAETIYGLSGSELKKLRLKDLVAEHQSNGAGLAELDLRLEAAASGHPQHFTWEQKRRNGELFETDVTLFLSPYDMDGVVMAVIRDVSRERRLERDNRMLAMAVEQAGEGILITDMDGRIEYANQSFERTTGYTRGEVLGQNVRILKSGQHDADFYAGMHRTLIAGDAWHGRVVNRKKNGELYTEQLGVTPLRDASGAINQYVAVKRDVSHEITLEKQLLHAQKMEAVGHLAGGVAHDFNNMLQVVMGNVELAVSELTSEHPAYEPLADITKAAEKSSGLVRQLLAFSRKSELEMCKVEVSNLVAGMARLIERVIGETIQFSFKAAPEPLPVLADPGQFEQALLNLCVNARDAMPSGGRLTVETELVDLDEHYCSLHPQVKPGCYACISVSDTGVGIPPEIRSRIFEPFFTTKEVGKGTGLGLASVYALVQRHGGIINLYSEVGVGTSFQIHLPISAAPLELKDPVPNSNDMAELFGNGETILVAEDDDQVRTVVTKMLTLARYKVIACRDGREALTAYAEHRDEISLVLLDVVMPRCNGREAYDEFRLIAPNLPIVFATGYSYHHLQEGLTEQVCTVHKPYNPRTLYRCLHDRLAKSENGTRCQA